MFSIIPHSLTSYLTGCRTSWCEYGEATEAANGIVSLWLVLYGSEGEQGLADGIRSPAAQRVHMPFLFFQGE